MRGRIWYEVRVRECIEPPRPINGRWVEGRYMKKSRFFLARDSSDAASKYKGKGDIMWASKVEREKQLGIKSFFTLGDRLLKELKQGGEMVGLEQDKNKRREKYYKRRRKEVTH